MFRSGNGLWSGLPPVTKNLLVINLLFWLASLILPRAGIDLVKYLGLHYFQADNFNAAQLVTYMFLHDPSSFSHLFFNMFSVFMFGRTLEMVWGSKRFLTYYLVTGIGAAIVQEVVWFFELQPVMHSMAESIVFPSGETIATATYLNYFVTIGASGAVFGILLAFGMMFPNAELFLMFIPIPIKAKYFVIGYGLIELFLGVSRFSGDNIAHYAHLGGMLFGFILIKMWQKRRNNGSYPF